MHLTVPRGYVISVVGSTWLWQYRARGECPQHYLDEPINFDPVKFGHAPVSVLLRAKFAVWAYTMVETARGKRNDPQEYETAMRRVDATGRILAVLLRGEIGPGPVILYEDIFRDPCGGPRVWQVTDDVTLQPYWHRPSAGYVIDHEELGEWGWEYHPAHRYMTGGVAGCDDEWYGEQPIPRELVRAFSSWHGQWRDAVEAQSDEPGRSFDWDAHNEEGLALARRLKLAVGAAYKVVYLRAFEEPKRKQPWRAVELRSDGAARLFEHKPYWSGKESLCADGQA